MMGSMETPAAQASAAPPSPLSAPQVPSSPKPPSQAASADSAAAIAKSIKTDPEIRALCIQALQQFRIGLSQSLLYTEGTVQFEKSSDATFATLNALLDRIGSFKLSIAKSEALINGERVEASAAVRSANEHIEKTLNAAGINALHFLKGMTAQELRPFLQLMARKKFASTDGAKVNQDLRDQGIEHIQVDELRYVAIGAEERVVTGDTPVLSQHSVAQRVVTDLVDAAVESIAKVQDAEARTQLRAELTDQLIEKDEGMFAGMLAIAAQRLNVSHSEEYAALAAVPTRDGLLLNDVLQIARLLIDKGIGENDECAEVVRRLVIRLTDPYKLRAEAIISQMRSEAAMQAVMPEWLRMASTSMQSESAEERLEGILRQSPCTLLDEQMFPQISDVLDELSVARMDAEAERLTTHIAGALQAPTKRDRIKAVERLSFLLAGTMEQSSQAVKILEDALLNACTHETCDEVMKLLLKHLSERCVHHYKLENYARSLEHLEWIASLEESSRVALRDEGANIARETREHLGQTPFAQGLGEDLLDEGEKGAAAKRMASILGSSVWSALIKRLRSELDGEKARALAAQVKTFGSDAVQMFFKLLGQETDGNAVLRLLSLAPVIADESHLWPILPALLRHPDAHVKGEVLDLILRYDGPPAAKILAGMLREERDLEKRKTWISALSRLKDPAGQRVLLDELEAALKQSPPDEAVLVQFLETFDVLENPGVIGPVTAFLRSRWRGLGLSANENGPSKAATMAGMRALARFYHEPAAAEILERARKDKDPEISRLALVCLRGIVAAEQNLQAATPTVTAPREEMTAGEPGSTLVLPRKPRRGFEAFQNTGETDKVFQPGMAIGGGPTGNTGKIAKPKGLALATLKPTLEGQIEDHRFPALIRMVGGREGVLKIGAAEGEALIYIRERHVLNATYAGKSGIEALDEIDLIKSASFAYYLTTFEMGAKLNIDIEAVQDALSKHRDQKDEHLYL